MAAGEELSRLEELLRRPDFVLEPSVKDSVRQYIKAGGKPEVILESLSEGYVGYAAMGMLMVQWMELVDDAPPTSHDEFHYLKEFAKQRFDPDKFIRLFGSASTRGQALGWLDGLLADPRGRKLIYELSAAHRNSLLLNFAIQKIMKMGHQDEVAAAGSGLASYFSVFHKLLANKVQALLATVKRAAEAEAGGGAVEEGVGQQQPRAGGSGGGGEGGGGGDTAASRVQREVATLVRELKDSCERSQHTYLHVQHVLRHLGSRPGGEALLAVAQQLEAEVAAGTPGLPVWSMQRLYAPPGCPPAQLDACHLIGRILQAGPDGHITPDVMRLHALYCSGGTGGGGGGPSDAMDAAMGTEGGGGEGGEGGGAAPSTAPLQHPRLLQALLACIFTPSRPPSTDLLTACADLLARATCTRPAPPAGRGSSSGGEGTGEGGGAGTAGGYAEDEGARGGGGGGEEDEEEERARESERVTETRNALHWAVGLLSRPQYGRFTEEDTAMAQQLSRLPVVAHGLLHATTSCLAIPAFYEDVPAVVATGPSLLRISLLVAEGRPELLPKVLSSWSVALTELHRAGQGELCRLLLDGCVALLRGQGAPPSGGSGGGSEGGGGGCGPIVRQVLELVEGWGRQGASDAALLRYFVMQLLAVAAPPYSPDVSGSVLRLLLAAGVRAHSVRGEGAAALLREFATEARPPPPLTLREQSLLAELAAMGSGSGGMTGWR